MPCWQLPAAGTHQVCDGGTTGAHRTEGSMPRRVQKGQRLLAPWHGHLKGANVLQAGGSVRPLLVRISLEGGASMATLEGSNVLQGGNSWGAAMLQRCRLLATPERAGSHGGMHAARQL